MSMNDRLEAKCGDILQLKQNIEEPFYVVTKGGSLSVEACPITFSSIRISTKQKVTLNIDVIFKLLSKIIYYGIYIC